MFLLDEIDKVGADWRGDPSSALLEVLDPAQNHSFRDHYLEVDLDLSEVIFLATANTLETIPAPLLDRMEIVTLDGYTEDEKVAIARDHLLPRQLDRTGLKPGEVVIDDEALARTVSDYTREAGVRSLERELGKLLRKLAVDIGSKPEGRSGSSAVDVGDRARTRRRAARQAPLPLRGRRAPARPRRGDRPRRDRCGWRRPVRRDHRHAPDRVAQGAAPSPTSPSPASSVT